ILVTLTVPTVTAPQDSRRRSTLPPLGHTAGRLIPGPARAPAATRVETVLLPVSDDGSGFAPAAVISLLAARGAQRILVEGGGITVSRFLAAGALDRLPVVVAPMLIGSGRPGLTLPAIDHLDQALRPAHRRESLGEDVLYELQLR
ncbi:MAG: RibD family protein, partial [Cyanobacteriota bacterium]